MVPTFQRNKIVDLTAYWFYGNVAILIPAPHETANINAVVLLDLFAQDIPMAIDDGLHDLARLFRPVLDAQEKNELPGI